MCDYSLEHLASRPAKVGDQLVTTKFGRTYTTGFCSLGEPNVAVCIKPGTELCGLRMVLLQHDISPPTANRLALALVTVGVVASSVILLALLNVHIA